MKQIKLILGLLVTVSLLASTAGCLKDGSSDSSSGGSGGGGGGGGGGLSAFMQSIQGTWVDACQNLNPSEDRQNTYIISNNSIMWIQKTFTENSLACGASDLLYTMTLTGTVTEGSLSGTVSGHTEIVTAHLTMPVMPNDSAITDLWNDTANGNANRFCELTWVEDVAQDILGNTDSDGQWGACWGAYIPTVGYQTNSSLRVDTSVSPSRLYEGDGSNCNSGVGAPCVGSEYPNAENTNYFELQ